MPTVKDAVTPIPDIVAAIGSKIIESDSHWLFEFEHRGRRMSISADGKRYKISVSRPRINHNINHRTSDTFWASLVSTIHVSNTRPAADIFKEIERRFDWSGFKEYDEIYVKDVDAHLKNVADLDAFTARMLEVGGHRFSLSSNAADPTTKHIRVSGPWYSMNSETITINNFGGSVTFDLRSVDNRNLALELVAVLRRYAK